MLGSYCRNLGFRSTSSVVGFVVDEVKLEHVFFHIALNFYTVIIILCGPGSSVGVATELWAGRSGIESRWE